MHADAIHQSIGDSFERGGAAGAAVLNAELMHSEGMLD